MIQMLTVAAAALYAVALMQLLHLHASRACDPVRQAVSDYGVGPTAGLFRVYGLTGMLAAALLAAAILLDHRLPARAGWYLIALAVLRVGVFAFPTDIEGAARTRTGLLHYAFAVVTFTLSYEAISTLDSSLQAVDTGGLTTVLAALYWVVPASLAGVIVTLVVPALRGVFGAVERVFLVSGMVWLGLYACGLAPAQ